MIQIPIERDGEVVVEAAWVGGLYDGRLAFSRKSDPLELKLVRDIKKDRSDLARMRFRSAGTREEVSGWSGLEGCIGAFDLALPAAGLALGKIEREKVV